MPRYIATVCAKPSGPRDSSGCAGSWATASSAMISAAAEVSPVVNISKPRRAISSFCALLIALSSRGLPCTSTLTGSRPRMQALR